MQLFSDSVRVRLFETSQQNMVLLKLSLLQMDKIRHILSWHDTEQKTLGHIGYPQACCHGNSPKSVQCHVFLNSSTYIGLARNLWGFLKGLFKTFKEKRTVGSVRKWQIHLSFYLCCCFTWKLISWFNNNNNNNLNTLMKHIWLSVFSCSQFTSLKLHVVVKVRFVFVAEPGRCVEEGEVSCLFNHMSTRVQHNTHTRTVGTVSRLLSLLQRACVRADVISRAPTQRRSRVQWRWSRWGHVTRSLGRCLAVYSPSFIKAEGQWAYGNCCRPEEGRL